MRTRLLFFSCFLTILAACGQGSPTAVRDSTGAANPLPPLASNVRSHSLPSDLLFVPLENGTIDIYPLKQPNKSGPVAQITGLTAFQDGMIVDANGNLFVANNGAFGNDDYVMEFAPPYTSPPMILNTVWMNEIFFPISVAVDARGTLYVSNCGDYCSEAPAVFVYPPGSTSPTNAITSKSFNSLAGLGFDTKGNLYAVNWNDQTFAVDVFKMRAGTTTFRPLRLRGLQTGDGGNGVSLDASGNIYVAGNSSGSNYVLEYRPGERNAFHMIDSLPFLTEPTQLQVGPDGKLYVPVACSTPPCPYVYGYRPGASRAFEKIGSSPNITYTFGVATAPNLALQGSHR